MAPHADDRPVEPWLRGTRGEVPAVARAVLHAFDLTSENFDEWVWPLSAEQLEATPFGLPSVAFQARHIARSLDRLLTYAEDRQLTAAQQQALQSEHLHGTPVVTREEFEAALQLAAERVVGLPLASMEDSRFVGRARLPVTLAGLLVHLADHTQRHAGQAVTTAKVVLALKQSEQS